MSVVASALTVRPLVLADLDEVVRIDALHTGAAKPRYWRDVCGRFLAAGDAHGESERVGLAASRDGRLLGFLFGEVRAFEFGSEACGWVFGIGVDPAALREGVATTLLLECCRRFRAAGVRRVRTMVERGAVPVLAFFRANGFAAGRFVQLEIDLEEIE